MKIKDRIIEAFNLYQIIVFGSQVYGQPDPDSDVDLLIVMESDERPAQRAAQISKLLQPRPFPLDILVRTPEEIRQRLEIGDYFMQEVMEQGKVLYERDLPERVGSKDYQAALALSRLRKRPTPNALSFHCQQCAEKYLKAFLVSKNVKFPKTHDLLELHSGK
jgi:predicted nucleotidyltransferase